MRKQKAKSLWPHPHSPKGGASDSQIQTNLLKTIIISKLLKRL
jgi:hypothetical protein